MRPLLSLCMIVKNEEGTLQRAISSVKEVVDEIVVVDTGSVDRTVEIARGLGARVYSHTWQDDFSLARNESIRHANGRYILWMDADDVVPKEEICKLSRLKKALKKLPKDAYYFRLVNPMEGEETQVCMHLRIFPNLPGVLFEGAIHEQVIPSLQKSGCREVYTDITIQHSGYHTTEEVRHKARRNLRILLKSIEQEPENYYYIMHMGFTYSTLGEHDQAKRYFKKVMECHNPDVRKKRWYPFASICYAIRNRDDGDIEIAESVLSKLLRDFPEHGYARFLLGEIYYSRGEVESSLHYLSDLTEDDLRFVVAIPTRKLIFRKHFLLGQCYQKMGRFQEAEHEYQNCLRMSPDSIEVMLALKDLYMDIIDIAK